MDLLSPVQYNLLFEVTIKLYLKPQWINFIFLFYNIFKSNGSGKNVFYLFFSYPNYPYLLHPKPKIYVYSIKKYTKNICTGN